jgi:hypothetical protein
MQCMLSERSSAGGARPPSLFSRELAHLNPPPCSAGGHMMATVATAMACTAEGGGACQGGGGAAGVENEQLEAPPGRARTMVGAQRCGQAHRIEQPWHRSSCRAARRRRHWISEKVRLRPLYAHGAPANTCTSPYPKSSSISRCGAHDYQGTGDHSFHSSVL